MKLIEEEHEEVYNLLIKWKLDPEDKQDLIAFYNKYVDTVHSDICTNCATQLRFMMKRLYHRYKLSTNNIIPKYEQN